MRKKTGANLVEYALPTAIVGIILGLGLYFFVSSNTISNNIEASSKGKIINQELILGSSAKTLKAGELGGTSANPKSKCEFNTCTIDYGSFILHGVPADFGNVASASRGADLSREYAEMLEELAMQLKDSDPVASDLLTKLAQEARKMAAIESGIDERMQQFNDKETSILNKVGTDYNKIIDDLSTIDPANLKSDDFSKLMVDLSAMQRVGMISQNQLESATVIALSLQDSYPNLKPWQQNFLTAMVTKSDTVNNLIDGATANLSANETSTLINQNTELYSIATRKLDIATGAVQSTSPFGPGKNFDTLLDSVPSSSLSSDIKDLVTYIGGQVQTIGDSVQVIEKPANIPNMTYLGTQIPPNAGINTSVAASIIENAG